MCGNKFRNYVCKTCNAQRSCSFQRVYAEGSGLWGTVYKDHIGVVARHRIQTKRGRKIPNIYKYVSSKDKFPRAVGLFGCTNKENGLFTTQEANGIMGLGDTTNTVTTSPNFIDGLFKSHQSKNKS